MGQSSSSSAYGSYDGGLSFPPPMVCTDSFDVGSDLADDLDRTEDIPDECLALIFQFLGQGDRKSCSLVSQRWLRVEGQSRHRLSLNAKSEIASLVPCLFKRFDSVTKLSLRCDRRSVSLNDDALIMISIRCRNLTRFKLRGCREITDLGISEFAQNSKNLKKLSFSSCAFGAKGLNAMLHHCTALEELSIKRLRGVHDGPQPIGASSAASSSLKSICLKELVNGHSFEPLVIGSKNLRTLKIIRCLGNWDEVLETMDGRTSLIEVHLERIQVSDVGLAAISKCVNVEILHIGKTLECSNLGLVCVAENCRQLRKLHIDGWGTNRIGNEGLIAVAKQCLNLQELVLIGVHATQLGLAEIAANCLNLQRLALCGSASIGDAEIACIAEKCVALKKLCIKGCGISDIGIEALSWGCPNLVKVKVKKCRGVSSEVVDWLQDRKTSVVINFDAYENEVFDESVSDVGAQESGVEFPGGQVVVADVPSSSAAGRLALFRAKLGLFASRNFVPCAFSRWSNNEDNSSNRS